MVHSGIVISVSKQRLRLLRAGNVCAEYDCSTASAGTGCAENSLKTPLGMHEVAELLGADAPWGAVFVERRWTGKVWSPFTQADGDLKLTGPTQGGGWTAMTGASTYMEQTTSRSWALRHRMGASDWKIVMSLSCSECYEWESEFK